MRKKKSKNDLTTFKIQIKCLFLKNSWLVEKSSDDDPVFTFVRDGWKPWRGQNETGRIEFAKDERLAVAHATLIDPWQVRERFFGLEDADGALAFLKDFGLWRFSHFDGDDSSNPFPVGWATDFERDPLPVTFSELMYQRDFFESALSHGPSEWESVTRKTARPRTGLEDQNDAELRAASELAYLFGGIVSGPNVSLGLTPESLYPHPVFGRIICWEIQDALRATVLLDWMEGREWPKCPECKKRFKRTSKHPMTFCSEKCSNRVRQRRFRNEHNK
jgi:hypothetical protein